VDKKSKRTKSIIIIVIVTIVTIVAFVGLSILMYNKNSNLTVKYNKYISEQKSRNITVWNKKYKEKFEEMIETAQMKYSGDKSELNSYVKAGSFSIEFETSEEQIKTIYTLYEGVLIESKYQKEDEDFVFLEFVVYDVSDDYYNIWVKYCESH